MAEIGYRATKETLPQIREFLQNLDGDLFRVAAQFRGGGQARIFHAFRREVLELALSARKEEAEAAIAVGSRFPLISTNLTMAMSAWKAATRGN